MTIGASGLCWALFFMALALVGIFGFTVGAIALGVAFILMLVVAACTKGQS